MKGKITLEISPSARSHCTSCQQLIPKGSYRVVEKYGSGKFRHEDKYCSVCSYTLLLNIVTELMQMWDTMTRGERK